MSDEFLDIADNMREPSVWIRVLFMIVFGIASYFLILPLIIILSIAQALFTLIAGEPNENLKYFSATLDLYISQIIKFLTYLSEEKPFPFSDFPEVEDSSLSEAAASTAAKANGASSDAAGKQSAAKVSTAKRKAPAKKAAKKKTAKKQAANKGEPAKKSTDEESGNS